MKKLIFLFLLFVAGDVFGQPSNYIWYRQRTRQMSFMADSALAIPRYNGTPSGVRTNEPTTDGFIAIDTTNGRMYFYRNGSWTRMANYSELTGGSLYVDSIWRVPGVDSIYWLKDGNTYALKDSSGVSSNIYTANGTLTGNRTVNGNNLYSLSVNAAKSVYFNMDYNDGGTPVYGYVDLFPEFMEIFHERNSARHTIAMTPNPAGTTSELKLESRVGSEISSIVLYKDSIVLDQADSAINFTRIRSTTDTATFKPLVFGNSGQVRRLTSWPGGTSYTFQNGLRESVGDVRLGNSLIENTTIDGDGLYDLTLNPDTLFVKYQASIGGATATIRSNGQLGYVIDTVTLAGFGAGSGAAGDTAAFTTDALYGSYFHNHDTLIITSVYAVIQAGATDTLGVQIYFNDSLNTGTTGVLSSTLALTSRPQGHSSTSMSNGTIPPGSWIWCKSPTIVAGRKPEYLSVSLIGYRKRRS